MKIFPKGFKKIKIAHLNYFCNVTTVAFNGLNTYSSLEIVFRQVRSQSCYNQ